MTQEQTAKTETYLEFIMYVSDYPRDQKKQALIDDFTAPGHNKNDTLLREFNAFTAGLRSTLETIEKAVAKGDMDEETLVSYNEFAQKNIKLALEALDEAAGKFMVRETSAANDTRIDVLVQCILNAKAFMDDLDTQRARPQENNIESNRFYKIINDKALAFDDKLHAFFEELVFSSGQNRLQELQLFNAHLCTTLKRLEQEANTLIDGGKAQDPWENYYDNVSRGLSALTGFTTVEGDSFDKHYDNMTAAKNVFSEGVGGDKNQQQRLIELARQFVNILQTSSNDDALAAPITTRKGLNVMLDAYKDMITIYKVLSDAGSDTAHQHRIDRADMVASGQDTTAIDAYSEALDECIADAFGEDYSNLLKLYDRVERARDATRRDISNIRVLARDGINDIRTALGTALTTTSAQFNAASTPDKTGQAVANDADAAGPRRPAAINPRNKQGYTR